MLALRSHSNTLITLRGLDAESYLAGHSGSGSEPTSRGCEHRDIGCVFFPPPMNRPKPHDDAGVFCYFVYRMLQLPFLLVSPHTLRWLFVIKKIVVATSSLALLVWAGVTALHTPLVFYTTLAGNVPGFTVGAPDADSYAFSAIHEETCFFTTKREI